MTATRLAYMPLTTYPEAVEDVAVKATVSFAASIDCALHVETFSVDLPRVTSGLADRLINVRGFIREAEERSKAECARLQGLVHEAAAQQLEAHCTSRKLPWGEVLDSAASKARYFDLSLVPWSAETGAVQDLAQAVVFGSGRPVVVVPVGTDSTELDHIAIAWDGSRVAARALGDALPLLSESGHISVLTVEDEKVLGEADLAGALASWLQHRGYNATPMKVRLGKRNISEALQEIAISKGSQLLAMGGFGHSRIRDFILGGATKGVLTDLRLPVLLSH